MLKAVNKLLLDNTEDYQLSLEKDDEGEVMIHIDVYNWNKSVYHKLLLRWIDLQDMLEFFDVEIIYGLLPKDNLEFASMFGWTITDRMWQDTHILVYKKIGE